MKKKVIFLDVDGVLNDDTDFRMIQKVHVTTTIMCWANMAVFNDLIEDTDAYIVISSTWRNHYDTETMKLLMYAFGFQHMHKIIGSTHKDGYRSETRGSQIQKWLDTEGKQFDIASIAIIDDEQEMGHLRPYTCYTNGKYGLVESDVPSIKRLLNTPFVTKEKITNSVV